MIINLDSTEPCRCVTLNNNDNNNNQFDNLVTFGLKHMLPGFRNLLHMTVKSDTL